MAPRICPEKRKEGKPIYTSVSADFIKKALGQYAGRVVEIHERMMELYQLGRDTDGIIRSLSVKPKEEGHGCRDISALLLRHKALLAEREQEIRTEMWRLAEEEETLERIWACYRALEPVQAGIIRLLYVEKSLYAAAEKASGMSHGKFEKERSMAVKTMVCLYHSEMDNVRILSQTAQECRCPVRSDGMEHADADKGEASCSSMT